MHMCLCMENALSTGQIRGAFAPRVFTPDLCIWPQLGIQSCQMFSFEYLEWVRTLPYRPRIYALPTELSDVFHLTPGMGKEYCHTGHRFVLLATELSDVFLRTPGVGQNIAIHAKDSCVAYWGVKCSPFNTLSGSEYCHTDQRFMLCPLSCQMFSI